MKHHLLIPLLASLCTVSAKEYHGNVVDVIDQISMDFPKLRMGVDPKISSQVLRKEMRVDSTALSSSLKDALDAHGLRILRVKKNGVSMISEQVAPYLDQAFKELEGEWTSDNADTFKSLHTRFPGAMQAESMAKLLESYEEHRADTMEKRDALHQAMSDGEANAALNAKYQAYVKANAELYNKVYLNYRRASHVNRDRMQPFVKQFLKVLDTFSEFEDGLPIKENPDAPKRLDPRIEVRAMLKQELEGFASRRAQSDKFHAKGLSFIKKRRAQEAYDLFQQAFELSGHDLVNRSYIGWLQLRKRIAYRSRLAKIMAEPWTKPDAEALAAKLTALVEKLEKDQDRLGAAYLSILAAQDEELRPVATSAVRDSLARLARGAKEESHVGRMDGLATRGGEFIGGTLLPISIALDTRSTFTSRYDFNVNDVMQQFDPFMQVSFEQMLLWLDTKSEKTLSQYAIKLNFKDLFVGKGGDSLGAVLGTSGFSAMYNVPIRDTVTATGSIRADGRIGPVGGIVAKLEAALKAGKRTVILPKDNENELYLLDPLIRAQLRVIVGDDMPDYLFHALAGVPDRRYAFRRSEGQYEAARLYQQLGLLDKALHLYEAVSRVVPNDYTSKEQSEILRGLKARPVDPGWTAQWNGSYHGLKISPIALRVDSGEAAGDAEVRELARQAAVVGAQMLADPKKRFNGGYVLDFALLLDPEQKAALVLKARAERGLEAKAAPKDPNALKTFRTALLKRAALYEAEGNEAAQQVALLHHLLLVDILGQTPDESVVAIARAGKALGSTPTFGYQLKQVNRLFNDWYQIGDGVVELTRKEVDLLELARRVQESGVALAPQEAP